MEDKINRAIKFYGLDEQKAKKEIKRIDKLRENHYKHYTERDWRDFTNYDICINSKEFGVEKSADLICNIIKEREAIN